MFTLFNGISPSPYHLPIGNDEKILFIMIGVVLVPVIVDKLLTWRR